MALPTEPRNRAERRRLSRIIRRREVCDRTGLSYPTIWRMEHAGQFPTRVQLNPDATGINVAVGWLEDEVDEWIHSRIRVAGRSAKPVVGVDAENGRVA
jgi:prophage regulatory protein